MSDPLAYTTKPMRVLSHSRGTVVAFRRSPRITGGNASPHQDYMYIFDKNNNGTLDTGDVVTTLMGHFGCHSGTSTSMGLRQPRYCTRKVTAADIKRYGAKFRQEASRAQLLRGSMTAWAKTQNFVGNAVKRTVMTIFGAKRTVLGSLLIFSKIPKRSQVSHLNRFHNGLMHALGLTDDSNKVNTQMSLYNTDYLFIDVK
jgi:hypothetical protein